MANEITITTALEFSKGGIGSSLADAGLTFDVTGTDYVQGSQSISSADQVALGQGAIGTPGYCYMKNTDSTNFVEVFGVEDEGATLKLKAGEVALFRFSATAPFLQADTAAVIVDYLLIED